MATQTCRVDGWPFHEVKWRRWRLVPVTALLDFVDDPANATFGGSGGMEDDITIISGSRHAGKGVPGWVT